MRKTDHAHRFGRLRSLWVYAASGLLALFTVFVLLDTFAIARVQQTAMAVDYSSIVEAQGDADPSGSAKAQGSGIGDGTQTEGDDNASDSDSGAASAGKTRKGKPGEADGSKPGGTHAGKPGGSGSKPKPGSGSPSSKNRSSDESSASDTSSAVVGAASASSAGAEIGSYSDDDMQISVSKVRAYDTDIYVADVQVSSASYLKTALAQNSFGRNLKDTTSNMADGAGAVLAVNGDYYGFRDYGYVLRNGVLYRDTAASGTDALVVYGDGSMGAASQDDTTAEQLKEAGAWQILSFGPVLVNDGKVAVAAGEEVGQSMSSNPRTAIGMVSPLHYVVVVSDGRTDDNAGLSLDELAQVLVDNGATFAYNLDGGGSTTMCFQGEVLNNPTSGNRDGERQVSDIVYFG